MDNLKNLEALIEQHIDPNGTPGSILAENHQAILKEVLTKVGKWTGSAFVANKNATAFPSGTFSWNNNAMNNTSDFTITMSKKTADLNDVGIILETMVLGDVIQFKDFAGRSVFLTYKSHTPGTDTGGAPIYVVTVAGSVDNPNYIYQVAEQSIAVLSYHKKLVDATPAISTDAGNYATIGTDGKIYVPIPSPTSTPVENRFADVATLLANQNIQTDKSIQYVGDASADATVNSGFAYYEYLGTTVGDLTDYRKLSEQESMDIISGSGAPPTQNEYNDTTALFANQVDQDLNYYQFVLDASADPTVSSGWAVYQYKGTTVGDLTDYRKIMEAESMDKPPEGVSTDANNALTPGADGKPFLNSSSLGGGQLLVSKTGLNIDFIEDSLWNEKIFLTSGDLILSLVNAVKGTVSIVYCDRYVPNISGEKYLISGQLLAEKLNELWFFNNDEFIELNVVNKTYLSPPSSATISSASNKITISDISILKATNYEILESTTDDIQTAVAVSGYDGISSTYTKDPATNGVQYFFWIKSIGNGFLDSDYLKLSIVATSSAFSTTNFKGYYNANETSGTTAIDALGLNNGTLNNITLQSAGKIGFAHLYNGTSSFIDFSALNGLVNNQAFTVGGWYKTTQNVTFRLWQNRGGGALGAVKGFQISPGFNGTYENTFIDAGTGSANTAIWNDVPYTQNDGLWHLIGLSFNPASGRCRLIIDAVIYEKTVTGLIGANLNGLGVLHGKSNANNQYYNGSAEMLFFANEEITQSKWNQIYNNGNGVEL